MLSRFLQALRAWHIGSIIMIYAVSSTLAIWPYIIPRRIAVVTNAMGTFCVSSVAENDLQKVAREKNLDMVSEAS
jgi:hypothetical protein